MNIQERIDELDCQIAQLDILLAQYEEELAVLLIEQHITDLEAMTRSLTLSQSKQL